MLHVVKIKYQDAWVSLELTQTCINNIGTEAQNNLHCGLAVLSMLVTPYTVSFRINLCSTVLWCLKLSVIME